MVQTVVMYVSWVSWLEWGVTVLPIVAAIVAHGFITRR